MPNWTFYPNAGLPPPPSPPSPSIWERIPDEVKIGLLVTCATVSVLFGIWKYWHFTRFEQPVGPESGGVLEVGNQGKSYFEIMKEHVHAKVNPEEVHLSAQEALRKQEEAREYAAKLAVIREQKIALRNRCKPLEPSGPILVEEDRPRQFMIEMYKPRDKDRVYVKPGRGARADVERAV